MVRTALATAHLLLLVGCTGIPDNVSAVSDFELDRYLGTWYEIARLDHRFERGLSRVRAEYSRREDGGIRVLNKGFEESTGTWKTAEGKAYFIDEPDVGRLKVSFFGPFYGAYNIVELDPDYRHAMVIGPDIDYLWILARSPELEPALLQRLIDKAESLGVDTTALIYPEHSGSYREAS